MEHFYSLPDLVNYHAPIFMDGWQMSGEYVTLLAEAPFTLDSTWKLIWDQKVSFVVTILTTEAKVSWSCLKYIDSHKYSLPNFFLLLYSGRSWYIIWCQNFWGPRCWIIQRGYFARLYNPYIEGTVHLFFLVAKFVTFLKMEKRNNIEKRKALR